MTVTSSPLAPLSAALADIVARCAGSVVEVQSHRSLASGFFWRADLIVTPDETLAEDGEILIERADGTVLPAELVGRDPTTDVALLRIAGGSGTPIVFAAEQVRPGSLAIALGAAESTPLVAFGVVAAVGPAWQSMRGGTIDARIDLDLCIRRRAEGGLAIAADGQPFGMAVRGPRGRAIVIPSKTIDRVADQLYRHGRVPRAYLGAGLRDVPLDDGTSGAMVLTVDAAGPAAAAGLRQGDIITMWQGHRVGYVSTLLRVLRTHTVGTEVPIGLIRGGVTMELIVTIGDRPPE